MNGMSFLELSLLWKFLLLLIHNEIKIHKNHHNTAIECDFNCHNSTTPWFGYLNYSGKDNLGKYKHAICQQQTKIILQFVAYIFYNKIVTKIEVVLWKKNSTIIHYEIKTMKNFIGTNIMSRLAIFSLFCGFSQLNNWFATRHQKLKQICNKLFTTRYYIKKK